MLCKFVNDLKRREQTYQWAASGTINILPAISHESAVFQIRHLMEWQSKLNLDWMIENENKRYESGEWLPWLHERGFLL